MSKKKKEKGKEKKGGILNLLAKIRKRIIEANKGGPTQAGKIDLKQQQWPM